MNILTKITIALAFGGGLTCATLPFAADSMERPKLVVLRAVPANQFQASAPGPLSVAAGN